MSLAVGAVLGRYRIERLLGRGGMGEVYLATQLDLGRRAAIKVLAPGLAGDPGFRERFITESRLAASLDHPHIIPIYEAGEADGHLFIAMRYVDGADLESRIREAGRIEPGRAIGILRGVAEALDVAHASGLVHRDVKPGNIVVAAPEHGVEHAYLADFGLVKQLGSRPGFTNTGQLVGSVDFVAPELIEGGAVDGRADVYSLACVLYTALAGQPPYPRDSEIATLWAHVQQPPPRLSDLRPELAALDEVIARGMAKRPGDRYGSARALIEDAAARITTDTARRVHADRRSLRVPIAAVRAASRGGAGIVAGAITLALLIGVTALWRPDASPSPSGVAPGPPDSSGPGSSPTGSDLPGTRHGRIAFVVRTAGFLMPDPEDPCADPVPRPGDVLYTMRDDGSASRRSTTSPTAATGYPALSPDGRSIAYLDATDPGNPRIAIGGLAGEPVRYLPVPEGARPTGGPRWSPDGDRIAALFLSGHMRGPALGVMEVDGTSSFIVWGTDPNILWNASAPRGPMTDPIVTLAAAAAAAPTPVGLPDPTGSPAPTDPLSTTIVAIDWLTDDRIAMLLEHGPTTGGAAAPRPQFVTIDPVDRDIVERSPILDLPVRVGAFDVAPDGYTIAFADGGELFTIGFDGIGLARLTSDDSIARDPAWSPDGRSIAFSSADLGVARILIMDVSARTVRLWDDDAGGVACAPTWVEASVALPEPSDGPSGDATDPFNLVLGALAPGTYVADPFAPVFRFTLPMGWEARTIAGDALELVRTETPRVRIRAAIVQVVYDGGCASSPTRAIGATAADVIAELRANRGLEATDPRPIAAGGATGLGVRVTVRPTAGDGCEPPMDGTALFPTSTDDLVLHRDDSAEFLVLEADGTSVVLVVQGPAADLDRASSEIATIVESITFP